METQLLYEAIETYRPLVFRIARPRMADDWDAEDVFQEVFVTYVQKRPAFANEQVGAAWFAKTTVHHCRKTWRKNKRHSGEPLESAENLPAADYCYSDLLEALSKLPEKYRKPLELFYFAGLSTEEAARVMSITPNALRIRMSRARDMLKDLLKDTE